VDSYRHSAPNKGNFGLGQSETNWSNLLNDIITSDQLGDFHFIYLYTAFQSVNLDKPKSNLNRPDLTWPDLTQPHLT
jgi:hypothetical protein